MTTLKEIEHAMRIAAKIVTLYGDTYLPTFQRLHSESLKAKEREGNKLIALKLAMDYSKSG
jgi:hypothetical protein